MQSIQLDNLDNEIIRLLKKNGRMPIGEMARELRVTAPTIRNRIRSLENKGLFQVAGVIDPERHPGITTALVGMNIRSEGKLDIILEKISELPNVVWAGVVTGRYDVVAEVACVGGTAELYRFTTDTILRLGNVIRTETFVIMKSRQNWIRLPDGLDEI